tara:strand:- start:1595 stop:4294 length:2700 start_codon:yes stop_codon:yes gene_type:complete
MANEEKTSDELIGGIDPNAFDAQMLLMDVFLENIPGISMVSGPQYNLSEKNVPYFPQGFDSINTLCGLNLEGSINSINNFITQLTPLESAKIYPSILLQIVDHKTDVTFSIPLSGINSPASTGKGGLFSYEIPFADNLFSQQTAYFVKNEVGLKSLSLQLDGNDLTFFGKSYIVSLQLLFDSMNTLTNDIKGTTEKLGYPVTFAQAFRSAGVVGVERFYTRLQLSYTSNDKEIISKYALNSPQMKFFLSLELIETKINVEENLKVSVDVTYQSRDESLFNSNLIFDFLGLDLKEAEKEKRERFDLAAAQKAYLDQQRENYVQTTRDKVLNNIEYSGLRDRFKGVSDEQFKKDVKKYGKNTREVLTDLRERYLAQEAAIKQSALEREFESNNDIKRLRERIKRTKQDALDALSNVRHDAITRAIEQTFGLSSAAILANFTATGPTYINTIALTSQQIYDYYNQVDLTEGKKKDLSDAAKSKNFAKEPVKSTVQIKGKPKEGNKAKQTNQSGKAYDAPIEEALINLGRQKQIDYILFGDIMRIVYKRLYDIKNIQAGKLWWFTSDSETALAKIEKSLNRTILLFSEITFESFEKKVNDPLNTSLIEKSLYDVPISVKNLRYILAKKLYGQQQNYFTIFQLMDSLIELISLTRRRKAQVISNQASVSNFTLKKLTYPMSKESSLPIQVCTEPKSPEDILSGMLIYVKRAKDNKPVKDALTISPKFVFGGPPAGIIKSFKLNEIADDDLQKLVMEQLRGANNQVIPSFFEAQITTILAPFFQLGMQIRVLAPTLDSTGTSLGNIFITGDYQVASINHEFTAGSSFNTTIKATLYNSDKQKRLEARGLKLKEENEEIDYFNQELSNFRYETQTAGISAKFRAEEITDRDFGTKKTTSKDKPKGS